MDPNRLSHKKKKTCRKLEKPSPMQLNFKIENHYSWSFLFNRKANAFDKTQTITSSQFSRNFLTEAKNSFNFVEDHKLSP